MPLNLKSLANKLKFRNLAPKANRLNQAGTQIAKAVTEIPPVVNEKSFLRQMADNALAMYNPMAYAKAIKAIPESIQYHKNNLTSAFKNLAAHPLTGILGAAGAVGGAGLDAAFSALPLYSAVKDREDLDTAGMFENIANRGADVLSGLAFTTKGADYLFPGGLMSQLPFMFFAPSTTDVLSKGGRALDKFFGTGPTKEKVMSRFATRVNERMKELNPVFTPGNPNPNLMQQAVNDVLSNGQDYLKYINS